MKILSSALSYFSKLKYNSISSHKGIIQYRTSFQRTNFVFSVYTHRCYAANFYTAQEVFNRKFSKMTDGCNHLVFMYGTLKRGEPNYDLIENKTEGKAEFLGNAKTVKKWPLVIASRYNIPYLLYAEGKGEHVVGEIYRVDDVKLAKLDELECHPVYYTRLIEEVQMMSENKEILKPMIYFLKNFRPELLSLPCLSNYSSKGPHGLEYVSRYIRNNESYYHEVMNV